MFFCNKNVCNILNTAYQIFNVVTKNRCHLWRHTFKKSQKYLYNCKNLKKTFLQLRCSNVLLHLKYKLPFCKPEIEFKNLMGAKALATDHRENLWRQRVTVHCSHECWPSTAVIVRLNGFPASKFPPTWLYITISMLSFSGKRPVIKSLMLIAFDRVIVEVIFSSSDSFC